MVLPGGRHSWLYEFPEYRAAIARFLATTLGGPVAPEVAARLAERTPAERLPDPERLTTLDEEPGGFRSLVRLLRVLPWRGSAVDPTSGSAGAANDAGTPAA
jgi:hypothetical protein